MKFLDESDKSSFDSKDFVRLGDGDEIIGVCVGDVFKFKQHWTGSRSEVCSQDTLCTFCAQGVKPGFRFRVNFIVKQPDNTYLAKILEQGWNFLEELDFLNSECDGHLERHAIKISRKGKAMDTKYRVKDMGSLSTEKLEVIAKVSLHDLSLKEKAETPIASEPKFDDAEELPF